MLKKIQIYQSKNKKNQNGGADIKSQTIKKDFGIFECDYQACY